ncbi:conserved hypothetical protein [Gammaproteobacteria bacterium]
MQRNDWTFEYTASRLAKAAAARCEHHQQRLTWWKEQKDAFIAEVKNIGIETKAMPAMADDDANRMPPMMMRSDLQRRLAECRDKEEEHNAKVREFDIWHRVLMENPETKLNLHQDDWLYFFG